jgi:hypothetical protein
MCLHVTISEVQGGGKLPAPGEIKRASGLVVHKERGSRNNTLQLFAWERDCGCGLLVPGGRIDAKTWNLDPEALPRIVAALKFVSARSKRFAFSALFFGEQATTEIVISRRDLSEIILQNQIRNYYRYIVVGKLSGRRREAPANSTQEPT